MSAPDNTEHTVTEDVVTWSYTFSPLYVARCSCGATGTSPHTAYMARQDLDVKHVRAEVGGAA